MDGLCGNLKKVSAERIQVELIKMLVSPNPAMMKTAYELGITNVILPEFDAMMETTQETPHHMYTVGEHTLKAMQVVRADTVLRLTMLFHDIAKPLTKTMDEEGRAHFKMHDLKGADMTKDILKRLKFDNDTLNKVLEDKFLKYIDFEDCYQSCFVAFLKCIENFNKEGIFYSYVMSAVENVLMILLIPARHHIAHSQAHKSLALS